MRKASEERRTRETEICVSIDLDGSGKTNIATGVGFLDHMLHSFAVHGRFDLEVAVEKSDLEIDCHHTVEDTGIVLGKAIGKALGDKAGIARFGSAYIPMDEALSFAAVDISGRPFLVYDNVHKNEMIGNYETDMTEEFFRAVAFNAGLTLHLRSLYGANDHHRIEAMFKAFAYAMAAAVKKLDSGAPVSTKGVL
ncbi:imidazoleglycerol-phosphate dehydratase HisB [Zongyangia hominis]|uniref:Imidazoleglycerol-phosphate dehydratase n=1 Tax=Zongyangia hominis TaxID=2763677 RepID=A0A926EDB7_9FIRM|nr:imidazoleglycerol-phosphate dehydratase HisB [Zongyangia hominis]MBC8569667.1 imidazoleglycerol-phosphate dehydratase HisB [Zongyangia hominis]